MMIKLSNQYHYRLIQALIILLPTYLLRFTVFTLPLNVLDLVIGVIFTLVFLTHNHNRPVPHIWVGFVLLFVGIGGLGVMTSTSLLSALGAYKSLILLPMLAGLSVWIVRPTLKQIVEAISILSLFIGVIGLAQFFTKQGIPSPWNEVGPNFRITSIFEFPNAVGLLLAPLTSLLIAYTLHVKKLLSGKLFKNIATNWFLLSVIGLNCIIIVMAQADGAIVAVAAATTVSLLFTKWRWLTAGLVLIVGALAIMWEPTRQVLLFQDASGEVRLAVWEGTWALLQDNMLFGSGLSTFPELYAQYKLDRHVELLLYPHNIFLNFWTQLGMLGLLWITVVLGKVSQVLIKARTPITITLFSFFVAFMVYGLVDVPYFKNDLATLFWIILSLVIIVDTKVATKQ